MFKSLCFLPGFFDDVSVDITVCAPKQRAPLLMHQAAPYLLQKDASHSSSCLSFAALQNLIQDFLQGGSWSRLRNIQNPEDRQNWPLAVGEVLNVAKYSDTKDLI